MNKKIILIGASIEIVTAAVDAGVRIAGYVDSQETECGDIPYLGTDEAFLAARDSYANCLLAVTVDECRVRDKLYSMYKKEGFNFGALLFGFVSPLAQLGEGCIVMPGARVSDRSVLSENCRLNFDALVGHDNKVERSVIYAPGAISLGYAVVGERTYIGANSTICPRVQVGADVMISAGSTVADNLPSKTQVWGYYPLPKMYMKLPNSRV